MHLLECFHQRSVSRILRIRGWQHITNAEVLRRACRSSIEVTIRSNRLRWLAHIDCSKIPNQLLFGELVKGKRSRGRPKKRWKDCAKEDLNICGFPEDWHALSSDCDTWRQYILHGKSLVVLDWENECRRNALSAGNSRNFKKKQQKNNNNNKQQQQQQKKNKEKKMGLQLSLATWIMMMMVMMMTMESPDAF